MSRFARFLKGVTSPFVDTDDTLSTREKRHRERSRRRKRYNSPETAEKAGDVDRRVNVNDDVRDEVRQKAKTKPYDTVFLRDISANAVVQAYIDTLSQDVAAANWSIKARDEDADISDEVLAQVERRVKDLPPPGESFRDVLEATTRVLLELGDAALVKQYLEDNPGRVAELVPVDSASMFKVVDDTGVVVEEYIQMSLRSGRKKNDFDVDDVVWVEWSSRPDRFYGQGPLEKAQNEVELIEELAEKERLDLIQGGPPGVLSPEVLDDYGGLPDDEDWDTFVESMRLDEGERHRVGYSKTPVNFEPISHNYQELQILDRSKYWVTVIGSVFKVNPSYAGFDFENVNRATDESQRNAYKQRGFRVTLRQIEEAINEGLIWEEFSTDIKFEFEKEQTPDERKQRAEVIETQASAGKEMANAGRDVSFRDGQLVVDDGQIEEGDVGGGGGGGGGLFGSVDDPDDAELAVDTAKRHAGDGVRLVGPTERPAYDTVTEWYDFLSDVVAAGGRIIDVSGVESAEFPPERPDAVDARMVVYGLSETEILHLLDRYRVDLTIDTDRDVARDAPEQLTKEQVATLDAVLLRAFERQITPPSVDAIEKDAWTSDEDVPEYVVDRIRDVVSRGAVFSDFDSVPGRVADTIEDVLSDALTQPQGWSLDSITDRLSDVLPRADPDDLETIARTESAKVLNEAREEGYRERGLDDAKFKWVGPDDSRTTDACEDLKDMTNPDHGGSPVSMSELVDKERDVHAEYFDNLSFRNHTIHPNERHTFVRHADTGEESVDVDVPSAEEFGERFEDGDVPVSPQDFGPEYDKAAHDHADTYGDVVTRVAKATDPSRRMREVEDVLGAHVPTLLRECLEAADGTKRGALREFNRRLEDADDYDVEERGKVSPNTLYAWLDVYDTHVDHLT